MGRTEYYNDPAAPKANTLIPASNLLVIDDNGAILLQRRRDTGQWALPGGAQDIGETAAQCAVREYLEETGPFAEITGFLGVYTNPHHIVAYTDGEIRQQYENTYIGRPVGGEPTISDEADAVRFIQPADLGRYDIHPSMRQQIGDYLAGTYPYLGCAAEKSPTPASRKVLKGPVTKHNARAIILDGDELVLIKRTKPGRDPYWVTVGGGVEATDPSVEDALHREVFEEVGGKLNRAELVHLITEVFEDGVGIQHIFAARLDRMDIEARTGTEFDKPERGGYEVVRVPFTAEAIRQLNLMPPELAEFTAGNVEAIKAVLDIQVRAMAEATDGKLTLGS